MSTSQGTTTKGARVCISKRMCQDEIERYRSRDITRMSVSSVESGHHPPRTN